MSDVVTPPQPAPSESPETRLAMKRIELSATPIGRMINTISLIAGLISVIIVISVVAIALTGGIIPDVLSNWGGIILGFYFGQFINLVKDYMGLVKQQSQ